MDIESFFPINTRDKIDEIINLIISGKEPRSIYTEVASNIQKIKMQIYFKSKFDEIKKELPIVKNEIKQLRINAKISSIPRINKNVLIPEEPRFDISYFCGITVSDLSELIGVNCSTLISIITQKDHSLSWVLDSDFILAYSDVKPCFDFIQNALTQKIKKDRMQMILDSEIDKAKFHLKNRNEKFKPSLGKEGNYGKLIYIPTKT